MKTHADKNRISDEQAFEAWYTDLLDGVRKSPGLHKQLIDNKAIIQDAFYAGFWACVDWIKKGDVNV